MKLTKLLTQDLNHLPAKAAVITQRTNKPIVQTVVYHPQILNLGVILQAYYVNPRKIDRLNRLGDCLSVGHYVQAPRTLKYGLNFTYDHNFQELTAKTQKHLKGEVQDCTISYSRDLRLNRTGRSINNLTSLLHQQPQIKDVYQYQNYCWFVLRNNGRNLTKPLILRQKIAQILKEKA